MRASLRSSNNFFVRVVVVIAALAVVVSGGAAWGGAAASPRQILFDGSHGGGGGNVYLIGAGGSGLRLLVRGYNPSWSPDGSHFAYAALPAAVGPSPIAGLAVALADGSQARSITTGDDSWPLWSPNGKWIAFTRWENGTSTLYLVRPDGSQLHKLRDAITSVSWSSDSRRLLIRGRKGLATLDFAGRTRPLAHASCAADGAWSPNGRWIAFAKCNGPTFNSIAIERPDGTGFRWLTRTPGDESPVWAPDSTRLAYVHYRQIGALSHTEIRLVSIAGKKLGSLASSTQDHDEHPRWSPDGRQIVFDRDAAIEPDGEAVTLLVGDVKSGRVRELFSYVDRGSESWRPT
jgi:Tol biopolymer transport system component